MSSDGEEGATTGGPGNLEVPVAALIERAWARDPNAKQILKWVGRIGELRPSERRLLEIGIRLEEGDRPYIRQHGFAVFDAVEESDHRLVTPQQEKGGEHDEEKSARSGATAAPGGPAPGGSAGRSAAPDPGTGTQEAEAGTAVRRREGTAYVNVGAVMDEDRWELGMLFPGFSPPLRDPDLHLYYREGVIQPLRWFPRRFLVRMYYENEPRALPTVRVRPKLPPGTPHVFLMKRNGTRFRALCYIFNPDGTWVRGRSSEDTAAEVLRQVVLWLIRFLVWERFGFWPGVDVSHDPEVLLRMTKPTAPCPYHAYRNYEQCCRDKHMRLVRARQARYANRQHMERGILNPDAALEED